MLLPRPSVDLPRLFSKYVGGDRGGQSSFSIISPVSGISSTIVDVLHVHHARSTYP